MINHKKNHSEHLSYNSNHKNNNDVIVVIAAFNEERVISKVVKELAAEYSNIVVVDDGSCDNTKSEAQNAGAMVLRHIINRGQGAALQTGISFCLKQNAPIIVTFDADGQHSPHDIAAIVSPIRKKSAEFVLGSRFLENSDSVPLGRKILLKMAIIFTSITSQMRLTDTHNGFRAFSNLGAKQIDIVLDKMAHASEIVDQIKRSKLNYVEVPVHIRYTSYSMSKGQTSGNAVKVALDYLINKLVG